jgi:hypothetical protein
MKKISLVLLSSLLLLTYAAAESDAAYRVGGVWLTEGTGFAKKGDVLRVQMNDSGWLRFDSTISGDCEFLTGYEIYGRLEASIFEIEAWEDSDSHVYDSPIPIPEDLDPSLSKPFTLPNIKLDNLTYTFVLTSVTSGTLNVGGYVDIDGVGRCEVHGDNALWRSGTEKPAVSDSSSGCSASPAGAIAGLPTLCAVFLAGRRRKNQ